MAFTAQDANGSNQNIATTADASGNLIGATTIRDPTTGANGVAVNSAGQFSVNHDPAGAATYRFAASFTPQATGAVTVITIQGSATKTVRVKRIMLGGVSTAAGSSVYSIQRTSALGAGGTEVKPTAAKHDTQAAAASAVVSHWTTTLKAAGTPAGGPLAVMRVGTSIVTAPTTGAVAQTFMFPEGGVRDGQALVLRGTSEYLEIQNINAGNLPAGTVLDYSIELVEE